MDPDEVDAGQGRQHGRRGRGVLALADGEAVGWCHLGPRAGFPRLLRSRAIRTDAPDDAWAVVCFFVARGRRGQGVARALLDGAVGRARAAGAATLEGYPVRDTGARYASTFAFVGVPALFRAAGFRRVTPDDDHRPTYRRRLR